MSSSQRNKSTAIRKAKNPVLQSFQWSCSWRWCSFSENAFFISLFTYTW